MYVVKRDGHKEPVMFDKITDRIKKLCYGLNDLVDAVKVAMRVIEGLYDGVTTSELDNLAAETAASISCLSLSGISPTTSPVAGFILGINAPFNGLTKPPLIKF